MSAPDSALWSPEFRAFHAKAARGLQSLSELGVPARDAPPAEWDAFYARNDRHYAETLRRVLARYPVTMDDTMLGGVRVRVIQPHGGENRRRVLINLRGGGFVYNRGLNFGTMESVPVAALGGIKVVTVDFRKA